MIVFLWTFQAPCWAHIPLYGSLHHIWLLGYRILQILSWLDQKWFVDFHHESFFWIHRLSFLDNSMWPKTILVLSKHTQEIVSSKNYSKPLYLLHFLFKGSHQCCFFRTQLMLHWTTTITSLDHNCHITETKLFQAEHFKLKSCSVNSMKCNSIVCDCLILSPPLIIAGVWRAFVLAARWGVWSLHCNRCVLVRRKFKSNDETGMAAAHDRRKIHEKGKQRQHRGIIR